jgi:glycosyltransferase involved in cell wall biosynthesis
VKLIAVIIPAHNEEATIRKVIDDLHAVLSQEKNHIIVTCDRCVDNTESIARECGAETIVSDDPGLAGSYRTGIKRALTYNPEAVIHIDADAQYEARDIIKLLGLLRAGCDMAMGNRIRHRPDGMTVLKYILNHAGSIAHSVLLLKHIDDITDGLRVFNQNVARLPIISQYTFTQEQVWRTIKAGYKIKFTPISFYKRKNGGSRLIKHPVQYIARSVGDFMRYSRNINGNHSEGVQP